MRHARLALVAALVAAGLAACGGAPEEASPELRQKQAAAARDAAQAPLPPEQDKATAEELARDLEAWK